jgi:hypothetical protein
MQSSVLPLRAAIGLFFVWLLAGCAATQVALEHKDLVVETRMSATIFLDVESRVDKSIYLDVRNTSGSDVAVELLVRALLEQRGYQVLPEAKDACYVLQANVLQVGLANSPALRNPPDAGSAVKEVTYWMVTDVQVAERVDEPVTQKVQSDLRQGTGTRVTQLSENGRTRRKYQTRILSTASKANLKFGEALPRLEEQLAKSLAGIF